MYVNISYQITETNNCYIKKNIYLHKKIDIKLIKRVQILSERNMNIMYIFIIYLKLVISEGINIH